MWVRLTYACLDYLLAAQYSNANCVHVVEGLCQCVRV